MSSLWVYTIVKKKKLKRQKQINSPYWVILHLDFFSSKYCFSNTIKVSNSLDPDEARRYVGPDLI